MARLVLHHRRVVELGLVVGRDVEELRGHLAGELVRLQLLRDHRPPHVAPASDLLRRTFCFGDRRDLAPGEVADLPPFTSAQEALTGVAVIPVSVIGPLEVELGEYELEEPFGRVVETGRAPDRVYVPLAHTEGSLSASLYRGARAVSESGGFKTFVIKDRITRASCFICNNTDEAVALARFLDAHVAEMRRWLGDRLEADPSLSRHPN